MNLPQTKFELLNRSFGKRFLIFERENDLILVGIKASEGYLPDDIDLVVEGIGGDDARLVGGHSLQRSHAVDDERERGTGTSVVNDSRR
jgi:hypothetical protein